MAAVGLISIAIGLMIDLRVFATIWYGVQERCLPTQIPFVECRTQDADVLDEANRVGTMSVGERMGYSLVTKNMSRMYGRFCSVNRLSFAVEP